LLACFNHTLKKSRTILIATGGIFVDTPDDTQIKVPYNRDLKALEDVLAAVRRPGDFFVRGALETPMPRVEIDGVGLGFQYALICDPRLFGSAQEFVGTRI
jgi:hypothetical protein